MDLIQSGIFGSTSGAWTYIGALAHNIDILSTNEDQWGDGPQLEADSMPMMADLIMLHRYGIFTFDGQGIGLGPCLDPHGTDTEWMQTLQRPYLDFFIPFDLPGCERLLSAICAEPRLLYDIRGRGQVCHNFTGDIPVTYGRFADSRDAVLREPFQLLTSSGDHASLRPRPGRYRTPSGMYGTCGWPERYFYKVFLASAGELDPGRGLAPAFTVESVLMPIVYRELDRLGWTFFSTGPLG